MGADGSGQEHQVGSLNNCISELQQQAYAQRLELQDAQHGHIESRREQVRLQEELSMKEKVLRDTQYKNQEKIMRSEIIIKEFTLAQQTENKGQFHKLQGRGLFFTRDDKQDKGTIPMPRFARRPSTMSSFIPVEFPQNSMVGQQRQQISDLQFDNFPNSQSFLFWKIRFKNQLTTCSDFPSESMFWIKEVEIVDSLEELKPSRSVSGKNCQILRC